MYESHFGLKERPFSLLPDPTFLYFSKKHSTAFAMLEYGLANQAGFTVISGGIGTGKTTLLRHLLNNLEQDTTVGMITNTHQSFGDLLQWILLAFDIEHKGLSKAEMYRVFIDFIINEYAQNRRTVLIVDEAQNMQADTLEELRMLSNVNADKDQVLQIILVGQDELRDTLQSPKLVQFCQRIVVDYQLSPLTAEETRELIRHRLEVAGGSPELFSDAACEVVYRYSGGTPRLVNLLCDMAMVYGFAEQREQIDADLVEEVAREKQAGGLFPTIAVAPPAPVASQPGTETLAAADPLPAAGALSQTDSSSADTGQPASATVSVTPDPALIRKRPLRIAIVGKFPVLRRHLRKLVEPYNIEVAGEIPLDAGKAAGIDRSGLDLLLVDMDDDADDACTDGLCDLITEWNLPVLFNDSALTQQSLAGKNPKFAQQLVAKLISLLPPETDTRNLDLPGLG